MCWTPRPLPDEQAGTAEQELLAAERHTALPEAFQPLPPCCQQLIALLIDNSPVPYAPISARLGFSVGSIRPIRAASWTSCAAIRPSTP